MDNQPRYTPKAIVEKDDTYSIPLYQRLFAWTTKEVRKLLKDLKEHFNSERFKSERNNYYLGMLTAIERNGYIDLIDGQQRFTVMLLFAIAFKNESGWQEFLKGGNRLRLIARSEDEEYIRNLSEGKSVFKYENPYMKEALLTIESFVNNELIDRKSVQEFADNVYNHLCFFISMLPANYLKDATWLNKYFEEMNSTGKGLEQHEILKVKLLKNQQHADKFVKIWNAVSQLDKPIIQRIENQSDENYADIYSRAISECRKGNFDCAMDYITESAADERKNAQTIDVISPKKKEPQKQNYQSEREDSIITFPEYLLLVLDLTMNCNGRDSFYQKDKLIERFEDNWPEEATTERFYNNLLYIRLLLDYYVVRRDMSNGQSRFTICFRGKDERKYREQLRQYLSMLTVSTEFYIWLKPYLTYLMTLPDDPQTASTILKQLKRADDDYRLHDCRSLQEVKTKKYPHIDRYWFWRLDYYLWEQSSTFFPDQEERKAVEDYVLRTNRSIEHLHPQDEKHNDSWENDTENIMNDFGNLAMISQSFNSEQSNDNVRVKFARIREQIDNKSLQSIKMLLMFKLADKDDAKWNRELAKEHGIEMWNLIEKTFEENK